MNYFPNTPDFADVPHLVVPVDEDGELSARPLVINTARAELTSDPGTVLAKGMAGDIICMWEIFAGTAVKLTSGSLPSWGPDWVFGVLDGSLVVELDPEMVSGFDRRPVHV